MFKSIQIDGSPKQISKLRNGHNVRIRGNGAYTLIVDPSTYINLTKSFEKNKASQIKLSPEEIKANKEDMTGNGIFGKKFDKTVEKKLGTTGKKVLYKTASEYLKPAAKAALLTSAAALSASQPELAPFIVPAVGLASDYLDNPRKYQGESIKKKSKKYAVDKINEELGTDIKKLSKKDIKKEAINKIQTQPANPYSIYGLGLYLGSSKGGSIDSSYAIKNGLNIRPNPELENFQYRSTLQPIYTNIKGNGLYL